MNDKVIRLTQLMARQKTAGIASFLGRAGARASREGKGAWSASGRAALSGAEAPMAHTGLAGSFGRGIGNIPKDIADVGGEAKKLYKKDLAQLTALQTSKSTGVTSRLRKLEAERKGGPKANVTKDTFKRVLGFGGAAAGLGLGVSAAGDIHDAIADPLKKRSYFKKMMRENPHLKREKPKEVKKFFNTIYKFNPTVASDPVVSGSMMKRILQFKDEGIQPQDIKVLTETRKHLADAKGKKKNFLSDAIPTTGMELAGI